MRRAAKVDGNHREVVTALRSAGILVADTSRLGGGFPDAVAARPGRPGSVVLIEIKDGSLPPSARRLTPAEVEFHAAWGSHVAIVTSAEDALRLFGVIA